MFRSFLPVSRIATRYYSKKSIKMNPNAATNNGDTKQVHQEMFRYIDQSARINIRSDISLKVRSSDVVAHPNGDVLIAELHGGQVRNTTASMNIKVSDDEKQVDVELTRIADNTDFHCELAVPIRADLHIDAKDNVTVTNTFGEELHVKAQRSIKTKDIRAKSISLQSENGKISCSGLLQGQSIDIETKQKGSITLDKLQGDSMTCKTKEGSISTNSCYVESSMFETDSGDLQLKNVHMKAAVRVLKKADVNMTGVHGNLYLHCNDGKINVQLSELSGENIIISEGTDEAVINISEDVEKNSYIEITSYYFTLDKNLSHLASCISDNKQYFSMSREEDNVNKLLVCTKGVAKLTKMSWMDTIRSVGRAEQK